jgi:cbb3-type cytochrome oxidase maturation protein
VLAIAVNWVTFAVAILMGIGAWFVYLWAVQSGQWKSVESIAERVASLDDRETAPREGAPRDRVSKEGR